MYEYLGTETANHGGDEGWECKERHITRKQCQEGNWRSECDQPLAEPVTLCFMISSNEHQSYISRKDCLSLSRSTNELCDMCYAAYLLTPCLFF